MKQSTAEWLRKADGDLRVAQREAKAARPVWDAVCYHAQQCAEKHLKAWLNERSILFQKTHDLATLLKMDAAGLSELAKQKEDLARLTSFAVAVRYPGAQADRAAAEHALRITRSVRSIIRRKLGIVRRLPPAGR